LDSYLVSKYIGEAIGMPILFVMYLDGTVSFLQRNDALEIIEQVVTSGLNQATKILMKGFL